MTVVCTFKPRSVTLEKGLMLASSRVIFALTAWLTRGRMNTSRKVKLVTKKYKITRANRKPAAPQASRRGQRRGGFGGGAGAHSFILIVSSQLRVTGAPCGHFCGLAGSASRVEGQRRRTGSLSSGPSRDLGGCCFCKNWF